MRLAPTSLAALGILVFASAAAGAEGFAQCHKWESPGETLIQQAQIWNPPDSGVTLHLERIFLHSDITAGWNVIATDRPYPELRNPGHSTALGPNAKNAGHGELRGLVNRNRGEFQVFSLYVWTAPAGSQLSETVKIEIPPGWGIAIAPRVTNASLAACFEWREN